MTALIIYLFLSFWKTHWDQGAQVTGACPSRMIGVDGLSHMAVT